MAGVGFGEAALGAGVAWAAEKLVERVTGGKRARVDEKGQPVEMDVEDVNAADVVVGPGGRRGPLGFAPVGMIRSRYKQRRQEIFRPEICLKAGNENRQWPSPGDPQVAATTVPIGAIPFKPWCGKSTFFEWSPTCMVRAYVPSATKYQFNQGRYIAAAACVANENVQAVLEHVYVSPTMGTASGFLPHANDPEGYWEYNAPNFGSRPNPNYVEQANMLDMWRVEGPTYRIVKLQLELRVYLPNVTERDKEVIDTSAGSGQEGLDSAAAAALDVPSTRPETGPVRCRLLVLQFKEDTYEVGYNSFEVADFFEMTRGSEWYEPIGVPRRTNAHKQQDTTSPYFNSENAPYTIVVDEMFTLEADGKNKNSSMRFKIDMPPGIMNYHDVKSIQDTDFHTLRFNYPDRSAGRIVWGLFYEHHPVRSSRPQASLATGATHKFVAGSLVPYDGAVIPGGAHAYDTIRRGEDTAFSMWDMTRGPQWSGEWKFSWAPNES